jgi:enediyne biosynthesis protein E4
VGKRLTVVLTFFLNASVNGQHFTDVSMEAGIAHQFVAYQGTFGGGATAFDINNDGYEDLFITGGMADDALYINNKNGTFSNIYASSGLKTKNKFVTQGAISDDVNKDGFADLFITTINSLDTANLVPRAMNLLFLNNGDGSFRNATSEFGLDEFLTFSTGACFGDINNDGFPDLFVANYFQNYSGELNIMNDAMIVGSNQMARSLVFLNKKGEKFVEVSEKYKIDFKGFCFGGTFTDYDNDGDLDILVNNDFGYKATPNFLYENRYPKPYFESVGKEMNMNLAINGMGTAVGDINNDGWLDYFFTNIRTNQFMVSQGRGKPFLNESLKHGTNFSFSSDSFGRYIPISWGCNFADFDNDGDLDLFVACGSLNPSVEPNPDFYFENIQGQFTNKAVEKGLLNRGIGRGSVVFDYNNDGALDLLVVAQKPVGEGLGTASSTQLFRNDSVSGNWLKISLHGLASDTRGIGATIKITAGNLHLIRTIDGGSGHLSQNSSVAHFGLGKNTVVDSVIVNWIGGGTQVLVAQHANTVLNIIQNKEAKRKNLKTWLISAFTTIAIFGLLLIRKRNSVKPKR